MKKFISALSSLVIAATAMGGALAVSSNAATNGDVDSTIIEFRSDGKNAITAKAGDTVPVSLYIPQSSGFYSLSLKMAINGNKTLGQGSVTDLEGKVHENYKDAFGNYGIKIKDVAWPDVDNGEFFCLNSGAVHDSSMFAGYWNADSMTFFTEDAYNIQYQAVTAINSEKNIDALGPWAEAGSPDDYSSYTPVYTWTKDESWAYKYSFVDFKLALPADLKDGTYTLDLYYDEYINCNPSALFDEKTNKELPDDQKTVGQTGASGVKGAQKVTSVPLKITVGEPVDDPVETTTATPGTTVAPTTTTAKETEAPVEVSGDTIVYDLIPKGKEYKEAPANAAGQNVYNATAGEELTIDWTVKNDGGTAGLQIYFDFSQVEYVSAKIGNAYRVQPQFNDSNANISKEENPTDGGQVIYTFGGDSEKTAKDGAVIYSFTVKVPEKDGTYSITKDDRNPTKVVPKDQNKPYSVLVHGLDIVVGTPDPDVTTAPVTTTEDKTTTTTAKETEEPVGTTTAKETEAPTTTTAKPGDVLYGDVNCDGSVKINDVVLLNRYLTKTAEITEQGKKNADCVNDGEITSDDSTAIKEFLARIIKALPKK